MIDKLKSAELRYEEISLKLTEPDIVSNNELYKSLMKEYKTLTPLVEKYREYKTAKETIDEDIKLPASGCLAASSLSFLIAGGNPQKITLHQSSSGMLSKPVTLCGTLSKNTWQNENRPCLTM